MILSTPWPLSSLNSISPTFASLTLPQPIIPTAKSSCVSYLLLHKTKKKHSKTYWPKTNMIYYFSLFCRLARWFFCWSHLGSLMPLMMGWLSLSLHVIFILKGFLNKTWWWQHTKTAKWKLPGLLRLNCRGHNTSLLSLSHGQNKSENQPKLKEQGKRLHFL